MSEEEREEEPDEIRQLCETYQDYLINADDYTKIKSIGKGGFAEVWLVSIDGTSRQAALKQLFAEPSAKQLRLFAREISTLAQANHPFFVKFLGFSPKYPLSLLSEYIPNGSLYRFIKRDPRGEKLTGTKRTLILMAIASAMSHLHKAGIIHRDLKSMNILLDNDLYPRLCDFGIARFITNSEQFTTRLGTPHWMAPETITGVNCGYPVDVYSFAMVMYELLTFKIPWSGMDGLAVAKAVAFDNLRPKLPVNTPKSIKTLIVRCWDQDPDKRPTFSEIYRLFATGSVAFEGTDQREIKKLNKYLIDLGFEQPISNGLPRKTTPFRETAVAKKKVSPRHFAPNSPSENPDSEEDQSSISPKMMKLNNSRLKMLEMSNSSLPLQKIPSFTDSDSATPASKPSTPEKSLSKPQSPPKIHRNDYSPSPLIDPLEITEKSSASFKIPHHRRQASDTIQDINMGASDEEIDAEILQDISSPLFKRTFKRVAKSLPSANTRQFLSIISKHFNDSTSSKDFAFILKALTPAMSKPHVVDAFARKGLHLKLPIGNPDIFKEVLDFLYVLFSRTPWIFETGFEDQMSLIIQADPDNALVLLQFAARKYSQFSHPDNLMDLLFIEEESFLSGNSISEYISTIFFLTQTHKEFRESHLEQSIKLYLRVLNAKDMRAVGTAYNCLGHYSVDPDLIDYSLVASHLLDDTIVPHILPLLTKVSKPVPELIDALVAAATTNEVACLVLLRMSDNIEYATILAQSTWWIGQKLPTSLWTFRLVVAVVTHESLRPLLVKSKELYRLFIDLCEETDARIIQFISSVVRRLPQTRAVGRAMSKSGALRTIIQTAIDMDDEGAVHSMLLLVQFLAAVYHAPEYPMLRQKLRDLLKTNGRSAVLALAMFSALSRFQDCALAFKDHRLERYFTRLLDDEDYHEYAEVFLNNIRVVSSM